MRDLGGLHTFMAWPRAILTDSGGYQVFSHKGRRKIDDDGVTFHSHVDGSAQRLTPESAMAIQADLGSDIAMAFDECPASDASPEVLVRAMERTTRWARRCVGSTPATGQLRFGIVHGQGVGIVEPQLHANTKAFCRKSSLQIFEREYPFELENLSRNGPGVFGIDVDRAAGATAPAGSASGAAPGAAAPIQTTAVAAAPGAAR